MCLSISLLSLSLSSGRSLALLPFEQYLSIREKLQIFVGSWGVVSTEKPGD